MKGSEAWKIEISLKTRNLCYCNILDMEKCESMNDVLVHVFSMFEFGTDDVSIVCSLMF